MSSLYFVPTPIGNDLDMMLRGVEVLNDCDIIYSNDINSTNELLSVHNINKPVFCYNDKIEEVLNHLAEGKNIAIVNSKGYSGVDKDSHLICEEAINKGYNVVILPGPNFLLTGLVTSGIPCDKFFYFGYLDSNNIEEELLSIIDFDRTLVFYEKKGNINNTLKILNEKLGNRKAVLALDITKNNEKYIRFNLGDDINVEAEEETIVIVVEGAKINSAVKRLNDLDVKSHYKYYLDQNIDSKEAMKRVAKDRGVSKSDIYKLLNK